MVHPTDQRKQMIYMALQMNCVVVQPDYRLAPEHKMPTGICDFEASFHFFHANAEKYGFNAHRMCLAGESGGALIALATAIRLAQTGQTDKVRTLFLQDPMVAMQATEAGMS